MARRWLPLEANPEVLTRYARAVGLPATHAFADVYGLDEELLAFVPQPVRVVILLFPVTPVYEDFRKKEEEAVRSAGQTVAPSVYFMRQTIGNACGTVALIHALANNPALLEDGTLKAFFEQTRQLSPEEKAKALEQSDAIAAQHNASSHQGQSAAPTAEKEADEHFVCLVERDGDLYELDGRKPFPINHGKCTDLLRDSVRVVRGFMARDPDQLNFSIIVLAPAQDE